MDQLEFQHLCLWCFHSSHSPSRICHLVDDKCEEIALEVIYIIFVFSSNARSLDCSTARIIASSGGLSSCTTTNVFMVWPSFMVQDMQCCGKQLQLMGVVVMPISITSLAECRVLGHDAYSSMTWFPLPLRWESIHIDGCPHCVWCICGHSCTGNHFLAYAQVKVKVVGWIYHLAGQQQFGFSSCFVLINL